MRTRFPSAASAHAPFSHAVRALLATILLALAAPFAASEANAQQRPGGSLYLQARVGLSLYQGDLDNNPESRLFGTYTLRRDNQDIEYEGYFPSAGVGGGVEIGYQYRPELAFGLAYHYGRYKEMLTAPSPVNPADLVAFNSTDAVHELQLRVRYTLFPQARISPFTTLGAAVALRSPATADDDASGDVGWAPLLGGGLDIKLSPRFALIADLDVRLYFSDSALDGANFGFNPGRIRPASASRDDDADFDVLSHLGLGLRYTFRSPVVPVDVTITGPDTLFVNELGTFTGDYNREATPPLDFVFDLGDGATDENVFRTSHAYDQPGTYTASFTGTGPINSDVASKPVVVIARPTQAPVLADCSTLPREAVLLGDAVRFFAQVRGTEPFSYSYDFGDGSTSAQPSPSHTYAAAGVYTATLTVTNIAGSATCSFQVIVTDPFCDEVSELNTVFYDYESFALTAAGRMRLDENLDVLRRCPDLCVLIVGYADDQERRPLDLANDRADAVERYYIANGIDPARLTTDGRGVAPDSRAKEDPLPGDRNARRAESIPAECVTFVPLDR
ncbi:MAG: PKD domain-containing protein [Bacteroidota bacterium]